MVDEVPVAVYSSVSAAAADAPAAVVSEKRKA